MIHDVVTAPQALVVEENLRGDLSAGGGIGVPYPADELDHEIRSYFKRTPVAVVFSALDSGHRELPRFRVPDPGKAAAYFIN